MPDFALPDLGEGLTEAEVLAWHVQVGDRVSVDQRVVEVETAKAAVELPVPFEGVVVALHAAVGEVVPVGHLLVSVEGSGGGEGQADSEVEPGAFVEPGVVTPEPAGQSSGNVLVGYGTSAALPGRRRTRRGRPLTTDAAAEQAVDEPHAVAVISPIVRKQARDGGLDLADVVGTGTGGLVLRRDVERALRDRAATAPEAGATGTDADLVGERRIALRGTRRLMAEKMSRSRTEIPEATVWVDVDATALLAARAALNAALPEHPVSLLALLSRFVLAGLRRCPELNARVEQDEIVLLPAVNLGFAAQTDRGLVVPVVRDAHRRSTRELSEEISRLTRVAREGSAQPADLTGGTFTINNYGVFGVDGSAAIINHPEVAILGIGRIVDRPWAVDGNVVVRQVCQLTLAFDHRVCDGGTAGGFLRYVADCVEAPVVALGDL